MINVLDYIPVSHVWTPGLSLCRELYLLRRAVLIKFYTLLLPVVVAVATALTGVFVQWVDPSPQLVTAWFCAMMGGLWLIADCIWPHMIFIPRVLVPPEILEGVPNLPVCTSGVRAYLDEEFVRHIVARPSFRGCVLYQYLWALAQLIHYYEDVEDGVRGCINVPHEKREKMASTVQERLKELCDEYGGDFLSLLEKWAMDFRAG